MDYRELPEEFLEKMKQFLGEEYPEYLASYEEEPRSGLRVNTGRAPYYAGDIVMMMENNEDLDYAMPENVKASYDNLEKNQNLPIR